MTPANSSTKSNGESFPLTFKKQETGDVHWIVANGRWETITHAETGEPNSEYVLTANIDGVEVPIASYNAGRLETVVKSQKSAQSKSES